MSRCNRHTPQSGGAARMPVFFAITYVATGIAAQFGLISQPLQYFMMKGLHLTAAQVSSYLAIMMLPWALKPFYGLICDFIPFLGYRRKSYLCAANLLTAIACGVIAFTDSLAIILPAFLLAATGMAASTALTVGIAVETGRSDGKERDYFVQQTFFYYCALIGASLIGGQLCHYLAPVLALHTAAAIAALPVLLVSFLTLVMLHEEKSALNVKALRDSWYSLREALRSRSLWLVALFIWCWDFSPSFGVPLFFHESNTLGFSQTLIGQLAAWNAAGMVLGSVIYGLYLKSKPMRTQLWLAVALGTMSTLAYLLLSSPITAVVLESVRGLSNMIAILAIYALAADVCPARTEVSVMASLIAVRNLATEASTFLGGQLYDSVFHNQLAPLIVFAAVTTALCSLLIPFLSLSSTGKKSSRGE